MTGLNGKTWDENSFGEYIRQRRMLAGLTLRAEAAHLGVTPAYLSDIERGNRLAPEKYLEGIKEFLQVPPEQEDRFYDLAGKSRGTNGYPDLNLYLAENTAARMVVRRAKKLGLDEAWWQQILDNMDDEP